jgi:hypothetical protein
LRTGRKDDALLHGHVLPFVVDEVANDVVDILAQEVLIALRTRSTRDPAQTPCFPPDAPLQDRQWSPL